MAKATVRRTPTYTQALASASTLVEYCKQQPGCQNCIFRKYGADAWKCHIEAFDLRAVVENIEAKKRNGGYL